MDLNVRAFRTVREALSESAPPNMRREAARKGGLSGGPARTKVVGAERRKEIAKKANAARWATRNKLMTTS
jgi:hypothetical protein